MAFWVLVDELLEDSQKLGNVFLEPVRLAKRHCFYYGRSSVDPHMFRLAILKDKLSCAYKTILGYYTTRQ